MPGNRDARAARAFHDRTTHTPASIRTSGHVLEWDIKPLPFKIYAELDPIPLPREIDPLAIDTLTALLAPPAPRTSAMTVGDLAALLYYSGGVTKKKTYPGGGEVLFRAAASTGALYQTEAYVAVGDVDGVATGLYHFCPGDFALRRLRDGDVRPSLADAAADERIAHRAATVVLSAIYWRNTWKYQARGYRHLFWDSGTMLANLTTVAGALGLAPRLYTGFVDERVNRLLGLDVEHEAALELVALGPERRGDDATARESSGVASDTPLHHDVVPLSTSQVDYPALREIHATSMLETADDVRTWRSAAPPPPRAPRGPLIPLPPARTEAGRGLGETIQRRGSTREFSHASLARIELATVLRCATRPIDADVPSGLVDVFLVVNAVDDVAAGAYRYWPADHALELVREGEFRNRSAYLSLEQPLGGDAAAVMFMLAPLDAILAAWGNRGYRLANLEAGLIGGRAYLAAYAQGFGASGLTFYDRLVVDFFAPHSAGQDAIFVTALGRSRNRVRSNEATIPVTSRLRRDPS